MAQEDMVATTAHMAAVTGDTTPQHMAVCTIGRECSVARMAVDMGVDTAVDTAVDMAVACMGIAQCMVQVDHPASSSPHIY